MADGTVRIETAIDTSGLEKGGKKAEQKAREIAKDIGAAMNAAAVEVTIEVEADTAQAEQDIREVEAVAEALDPEVVLEAETGEAVAEVNAFDARVEGLAPEVEIDADASEARSEAQALEGEVSGLSAEMPIDADTQPAIGEVSHLEAQVASLDAEMPIDADSSPAQAEVSALEATIEGKQAEIPVDADTAEAQRNVDDLDKRFDKVKDSAGKMAQAFAVAMAAVGAAIAAAAKQVVSLGMEFEKSVSGIKAVSGASADEMAKLKDLAIEAGAATVYSAGEAAVAIEELIKAGLSVEQVLDGGLAGALDLAAAGEVGLAEAAEIAATALNAFKDDAMSVADAANILAGAANASATDVEGMRIGLAQVSSVASSMGMNFQDTSTALAVFAQKGLKGSDAGTSLKTMLMRLQPKTDAQAAAFKKLGLLTQDGSSRFYDMDGSMRSLEEIAGLLQESMTGLSDAERAMALETMFGSDAIRGANILFAEGAEGVSKMWAEMSKVEAADVAAERLNNLAGDVEELGGAMETLGIQVYDAFNEPLREAAQAGAEAVRQLSDAMQAPEMQAALRTVAEGAGALIERFAEFATEAIPKVVDGLAWVVENFDRIAGVVQVAGSAFVAFKAASAVDTVINKVAQSLVSAGGAMKGLTAALSANVFALVAAGAALAVVGVVKLVEKLNSTSDEAKTHAEAVDDLKKAYNALHEDASKSGTAYNDTQAKIGEMASKTRTLADEIQWLSKVEGLSAEGRERLNALIVEANEAMPGLNLAYDEQSGLLNRTAAEMENLIALEEARARLESAESTRTAKLDEQRQAVENLAAAEAERDRILELLKQKQDEAANFKVASIGDEFALAELRNDIQLYETKLVEAEAAVSAFTSMNEALGEQLESLDAQFVSSGDAVADATDKIADAEERRAQAADAVVQRYAPLLEQTAAITEETRAMSEAIDENAEAFSQSRAEIDSQANFIRDLANETAALRDIQEPTAEESAKLAANIAILEDVFGDTTEAIEAQGGVTSLTADEIERYGDALAAAASVQLADERMAEIRKAEYEATRQLVEAEGQLATVSAGLEDIRQQRALTEGFYVGNAEGAAAATTALEEEEKALLETEAALQLQYDELIARLGLLAADSTATAEERAAAQAIVDEAVRNGMVIDDASLAQFQANAKAAEEAAKARAAAINSYISEAQGSYEGYAAKSQDLENKITQNKAVSLKTMQANLKENTRIMNEWANEMDMLADKMKRGVISEAFLEEIRSMGPEALKTVQKMNRETEEELKKTSDLYGESGEAAKNALSAELEAALGVSETLARSIADSLVTALQSGEEVDEAAKAWIGKALNQATASVGEGTAAQELADAMDSSVGSALEKGEKTPAAAEELMKITKGAGITAENDQDFNEIGENADDSIATGFQNNQRNVTDAVDQVASAGKTTAEGILNNSTGHQIGNSFGQGMASGILSQKGAVVAAANEVAQAAQNAAKVNLDIHSPSRVMHWVGEMFGTGFTEGIESEQDAVVDAAEALADSAAESLARQLELQLDVSAAIAELHDALERENFAIYSAIVSDHAATSQTNGGSGGDAGSVTVVIENITINGTQGDEESAREAGRQMAEEFAREARYRGVVLRR